MAMNQDPPVNGENGLSSEDEGKDTRALFSTPNSPDIIATFAINAARNLRLENSLLQFCRVSSYLLVFTMFNCPKLDVPPAMVYRQATLIKLKTIYLSAVMTTTR